MSDNFLETDVAIQALLEELQKFKSSSELLSLTDSNVAELLQATERLSGLSGEVAEQSRKQVGKIDDFIGDNKRSLDQLTKRQKEQSETLSQLASDTQRHLDRLVSGQQEFQKSVVQLSKATADIDAHLDHVINHQQSLADSINQTLKHDVITALDESQRLGRSNRAFAIVLLILIMANIALNAYVVWTLLNT